MVAGLRLESRPGRETGSFESGKQPRGKGVGHLPGGGAERPEASAQKSGGLSAAAEAWFIRICVIYIYMFYTYAYVYMCVYRYIGFASFCVSQPLTLTNPRDHLAF